MSAEKKYRHEIKLLLSRAEYEAARARLSAVLPADIHAGPQGEYFIRSLYLDDLSGTAYWEKLIGVRDRRKYRIRIYNNQDSPICLECKEKRGARIFKRSAPITRAMFDGILRGDYAALAGSSDSLCREVFAVSAEKGLRPSVVVDYDREAYVYPVSNTRLTFDKNLHAGVDTADVFQPGMVTLPVYPGQQVIFEIKYDEVLPRHIAQLIAPVRGSRLALSKFCLCRDMLTNLKPRYTDHL